MSRLLSAEQNYDGLFGDVYPAGYTPLGSKKEDVPGAVEELERWAKETGGGDFEVKAKAGAKSTRTTFDRSRVYGNAYKILKDLRPGMYWHVDTTETIWRRIGTKSNGKPEWGTQLITKDMLGFADIAGVSKGRFIFGQVTTRKQVAQHLRDYTSDSNTFGGAKTLVESLLRDFLANGGELFILGFYQESGKGSRWRADIVQVTPELLDAYKARKRPRRGTN